MTAPLISPVGDAKTVTSSEFLAFRGINMGCIWGESPPNPPLRPEWGGAGVSNDWCIITICSLTVALVKPKKKSKCWQFRWLVGLAGRSWNIKTRKPLGFKYVFFFQGSIVMCSLFVCQLLGVLKTRSNRSWMERFVHLFMSNVSYFLLVHASKTVNEYT